MRNYQSRPFLEEVFRQREPALRYGGEQPVAAWQHTARAKLYELLGLDQMLPCDPDFAIEETVETEEYTQHRFSFQSEPGYYVPCYIRLPKGVIDPVPPMICLQGHSKGMHISLGVVKYPGDEQTIAGGDRDFARSALRNGYCPVVIEQRYMGECGGDEKGPGCGTWDPARMNVHPTLMLGRTAIGERVWDVMRLIDVLAAQFPRLDLSRTACMGNSGGGTTAFYAACADERIQLAMPSCAVCTYFDSIVALHHCACNYIPRIAQYFDMGDLGGLIAPRKLIIVAGAEDPIFPKHGVEKTYEIIRRVYEAMGVGERAQLVFGPEGHRFYADLAYERERSMRD